MTNDNLKLLIPVVNHTFAEGEQTPTVNARDLYNWLEVKTPFSMWIKRRIEEYEFIQGIDFILSQNCESSETTTYTDVGNQVDYFVSLDMAKELAMVERTPKGKEARRYFIACEKALKAKNEPAQLRTDWKTLKTHIDDIKEALMALGLSGKQLTVATAELLNKETGVNLSEYITPEKQQTVEPQAEPQQDPQPKKRQLTREIQALGRKKAIEMRQERARRAIDDEAAQIILEGKRNGLVLSDIAKQLNEAGKRTSTGKKFGSTQVYRAWQMLQKRTIN